MIFGGRNCTGVLAPPYLSFLTASVSFVFFLVTVVGNSLICLLLYKDPNHQLRTPFNFLVLNLAVADLIVGLVLEPISVAIHLKEGIIDGPLGDGIPTIHMSYFISCTASVLSLAALTIDRNIAVTSPHYYRAKSSPNKVLTASLIIWIVSISLPFVYFKVGYISYAFVFANTAVIVTFVILIVSYARIYRKIRNQFQLSAGLQAGLNVAKTRPKVHENEARVTKAFLLVLVAYLLCYTPSCAMIYIMNFCTTCSCYSIHWLRDMQFMFVLLNSCLNPFLYACRLPGFRRALATISPLPRRSNSMDTVGTPLSTSRLTILSERIEGYRVREIGTEDAHVSRSRLSNLSERNDEYRLTECAGRDIQSERQFFEETANPEQTTNLKETSKPEETTNPKETTNPEEITLLVETSNLEETRKPEGKKNREETTNLLEATNLEESIDVEETTNDENTENLGETIAVEETTNDENTTNLEEATNPKETANLEDNEILDSKL